MKFSYTGFEGLILIEPASYADSRGYFFEAYNEKVFHANGVTNRFVQDNQSHSVFGVVRGLHYQLDPHAQVKLVRVLQGRILDVALDIRKGSPTFGKSYAIELSSENRMQLLIPAGFAHGFSVLSTTADVLYKCDQLYNRDAEAGILYNDPALKIDWNIDRGNEIISDKDRMNPLFSDCRNNFTFRQS
jgi:dTDP-4-dehydrorhamnose 3,5-epimerase